MFITVKDFIEENPYASIDVMNHKGVARLPVGLAQSLLTPSCQRTKLKVNGAGETILASELLDCVVTKVIRNRKQCNHIFLLTSTKAAAAHKSNLNKWSLTCQICMMVVGVGVDDGPVDAHSILSGCAACQ